MEKDEFVKAIERSRELVGSGEYEVCPCSQVRCEWHGKCYDCVLTHRVKKHHLPECLQPVLRKLVADLAGRVELGVVDARPGEEHFDYLYEFSPPDD